MKEEQEKETFSDKYSDFRSAWDSYDETAFDNWVLAVSDAYFRTGMGLKFAAKLLDVRPAELQAALNLAVLDEEELSLLAALEPPRTTWFSLASASSEALRAAIQALRTDEGRTSPSSLVQDTIRAISGPTSLERIAALGSEVFGHAAKKAEVYGLLNDKARSALKGWQSNIRTGRGLTPSQAAFAKSLFQQLAAGGAIVRDSADGDKLICDQILDAIDAD